MLHSLARHVLRLPVPILPKLGLVSFPSPLGSCLSLRLLATKPKPKPKLKENSRGRTIYQVGPPQGSSLGTKQKKKFVFQSFPSANPLIKAKASVMAKVVGIEKDGTRVIMTMEDGSTHPAFIPLVEVATPLEVGSTVKARVIKVNEDGSVGERFFS